MFSCFRRKPKVPRLIINIYDDNFRVEADWPDLRKLSKPEVASMAESFGKTIWLLSFGGPSVEVIRMAVARSAYSPLDKEFVERAFHSITQVENQCGWNKEGPEERSHGPVIRPSKAFDFHD